MDETLSVTKADYLATRRAQAVKDGNLVLAGFIASQMPGQKNLSATELPTIRRVLRDAGATLKQQLWPLYFMAEKDRVWDILKQELDQYLTQGQFSEALEILIMLKQIAALEAMSHRYSQIIEALPKIFYTQDQANLAFEAFMHQELAELMPEHQKLLQYYARTFFYLVDLVQSPSNLLRFCRQITMRYQIDSVTNLDHQLMSLADDLRALNK